MNLNKIIKISKQHAEAVYNIALEKHNRDTEKFAKKEKELIK